jgi:hypothetical protein
MNESIATQKGGLRRFVALFVAIVATLALSGLQSARAATMPAAGTCDGMFNVSPGLFAPGFGPNQTFDWTLETECEVVSSDGVETFTLTASGTGTGFCSAATAEGGTGTLHNAATGQTITLTDIGWVFGGRSLLVSGNHDAGGQGEFQAQVDAQNVIPLSDCHTPNGATAFLVVIVAEFV